MRYFLKRMLAILLVAVMAASMLGLDSSAANQNSRTAESADTASDESGTSSDTETEAADGITRVEWLQELITLFELSVDEDNYPEHGFSDVDSTSEYYDIVYTAAEYGFLPVEAGQAVYPEKAATRQFVAQTLNFGLGIQNDTEEYTFSDSEDCSDPDSAQVAVDRGWFKLDSGNFLPEQAVVSEEVTVILEDAKAILQEAEVDENYNSEYKFADWVVVFPEDEEVTIDENDVVTITNSDVSLSEGDTFVVWPAEIPAFYVADSITTSGNIQTITTSEANVDEALLDVDASGSIDVDLEEFEGADGFDVEYIETEAQARSAIQTYGISVKNGSVIATKNFTVGKGLKVGFTCNLSNLKLNHKESGKSSYYISVSGNYTVTSSVTLDMIEAANGSSSITIGTVPVAGVGKVTISLDLALNGEIAYTYEGKFEVGMQKLSSGGVSFKKNFKKTSFYSDIEAQATVAVKVSFGVDVYFANGNIYATTGLDSKFLSHEYNDGESPNKCSSLSAWWFTKIGYSAQIGIGRFAKSYSDSMYIYDAENSPVQLYFHWEDGVRVYSCARGEYGYFTPFNSRYGGSSYGGGTSSGTGSDGSVFVLYTYTLDEDNNATITGYNGNAKVLMIPETIDGYTVTAIGESTFKNNTSLIYVSIPDTVTSIKSYAFSNCTNLNEVHLSSALKTMGTQAFSYCTSLTSITIPKTLQECSTSAYISYNAKYDGPFYECSALKSVTFEEGSTKIAHRVLSGCTGIEAVTIPETVTEIGEKAFGQCTSLKKIEIPLSVTKIDSYAFAYCSALEVAKIGDSVTTIGAYVFYECKNLLLVEIPDSVISMGNYDFYGCSGLQSVKLSSKQEKIMSYMFYGCTNLTTIELPNSVTTIQQYAFSNTGLKKIVLSENVITVNDRAFYDCDALTDINIPNSVTSIGTYCFANCEALNNITLGTGIGIIPAYAFYQCPALESIVLPYRVTSIGEYAFANNTKLVSVFIPRNTTSIDTTTFSYPSRMTIYGITGTYAETFANEQGITFVNQEVNATEATLSASNLTINKGEKETLTLKVLPADFTDEVTWKSSDTSVATVTDAGVVTAVATGTATIKVTVGSVSASCKVTVIQPVTGISLNKTSLSLEALDTYQLKATVSPTTAADKTVTWTSSEPNVATVDESGLVTALSKGTTKVTVKANDGSGVSKTCNVTVTNTAHICTTVDEMESPHNYTNDCSDYWVYTASGVTRLAVTFDERTNIEDGFDYLYIYDEEGTEIGKYTGTELAGQTVNLTGNTVKIKLVSDSSGNEWGFKVTDIDSSCQHTSTKIQNKKDATCTENGYTGDVVCEDCGKIIETGTVIEAAGHTVVNVSAVDATCTTDGNTAGKYCSVCDEILEGMTVIPAKGHTEVIDEKVDATCTENGLTEGKHCSVCHAILVEQTVILASHNWDEGVESVAPTCDDEGVILYTCKVCGETKTQAIAKKGHTSEKDEAVEPTCTTPGLTEGSHCSVCGAIIEAQEEVPAKGHDLETITTKATTSKNGSVVEKCSVCGEITSETDIYYPKTITLSKTSFVYSGNVQKPAVTVKGSDGKGIAASNYTLTYSSGCKNVGKYTVKITFKGNYSGNISKTFTIVPKGTSISKLTASSKGFTVKWKKQATQTSGYQIQYSTKSNFAGAKTVTVTKNSTVSKKITKLSAKKKYYVRIRTYKTVSGTKYYSSWSSAKQVTTKK